MDKKVITEKDKVHEQWYEEAKKVTPATIGEFVRHLTEDYVHDYGTICYAVAAAAVAAAHAVDHSPTGGITGFQAGAIMWEFIDKWGAMDKGPKRMVCYENMLYPQYEDKFDKTISKETWEYLQKKAKEHLAENGALRQLTSSVVVQHWESIAKGIIPFGYRVASE